MQQSHIIATVTSVNANAIIIARTTFVVFVNGENRAAVNKYKIIHLNQKIKTHLLKILLFNKTNLHELPNKQSDKQTGQLR